MKKLFLCFVCGAILSVCAFGQTYRVLYNFVGPPNDGAGPFGQLVRDSAGNFFGITIGGGSSTSPMCGGDGCGTAFELSPNGDGTYSETIIHDFCAHSSETCPDGLYPFAALTMDAMGNLFGITELGGNGAPSTCGDQGCGTAFKLSPPSKPGETWIETVLHNFCSDYQNYHCLDGIEPVSSLTLDSSGNLYGATDSGGTGSPDGGIVFELIKSQGYTATVLYNFGCQPADNCPNGLEPSDFSNLVFDRSGNLYGTTSVGGSGQQGGTVYKLQPSANGWIETIVFNFNSNAVGAFPGFVTLAGNDLYVTTRSTTLQGRGPGTLVRLSPRNGGRSTIFRFDPSGIDGASPSGPLLVTPGLIMGATSSGGLYGTIGNSGGTIFSMTNPSSINVLYNFCSEPDCLDGSSPFGVIEDSSGNLYGNAGGGGLYNNGVVFEFTP